MKLWPFGRNETRDDSYTDTLVAAITARAQGKALVVPTALGALEACAGVVGRGFAAAEVTGGAAIKDALTPAVMEMIGRAMIRAGELVMMIDTADGVIRLLPAESHDVEGGPNPESWTYGLSLGGPSETLSYDNIGAERVLHFRYAADPARPWRGNSPLHVASLAGRLSAETVNQLADESSGPTGALLGIPKDGDDETVAALKGDIANARGRVALLESGDWDNAGGGEVDLAVKRFGADPPESMVHLLEASTREVWAACGFHSALFGGAQAAAAVREAWRLALFGVLSPLGRMVQSELRSKLGDVTLDWSELRASDLSGRARAFQSLVGGGMPVADAVAIAGLMVDD